MIKVVTDSVASLPKELIEEENIEDHQMHSEFYSITPEAAAKPGGKRG